jgi:BirA family biotin operon repressor/biotin-[acetyl-CoA-carboxylase] ligase
MALDSKKIFLYLSEECNLIFLDAHQSSNEFLKEHEASDLIDVCVIKNQLSGNGQYGRKWISHQGESITFSIRIKYPSENVIEGLSVFVGMSLIEGLEELGIKDAKLKWPNDILINNKKLSGVLIENIVYGSDAYLVIGIGINYDLNKKAKIDIPWTNLCEHNDTIDINKYTGFLINRIIRDTKLFLSQNKTFDKNSFEKYDYLKGRFLDVNFKGKINHVSAIGVNSGGALMVNDDGDIKEVVSSKDVIKIYGYN